MARVHCACLVGVALLVVSLRSPKVGLDASADSRQLAHYIESNYETYMVDFIHVFLGHLACDHDFVEEEKLNSLADEPLKILSAKTREIMLASGDPRLKKIPADVLEYFSDFAVLASMELWSNHVTKSLAGEYEGDDFDCDKAREQNALRYEQLQAFRLK